MLHRPARFYFAYNLYGARVYFLTNVLTSYTVFFGFAHMLFTYARIYDNPYYEFRHSKLVIPWDSIETVNKNSIRFWSETI